MGIFTNISNSDHENVVFCQDKTTGLKAIIAIHDTTLGPALGGCRMWNYASEEDAVNDVLRLSKGMTYKASVAGLSLGGGKAVIIGDPSQKSEAMFRVFGRFVHGLGGRYITAEDVNISVQDMEYVAAETPYVTGISSRPGGSGDPSPITALGVFSGIQAAVFYKLKRKDLKGLKIAVQGCGNVGRHLCGLLNEAGAELIVADIDEKRAQTMADSFKAKAVSVHAIHQESVDVFAPCALGAILNSETIPQLNTPIVAGGANNQLQDEAEHGLMLKKRDILYAPDYVINAGGLINVIHELKGYNREQAREETKRIYNTLLEVFAQADNEGIPTQVASNRLGEKRIEEARRMKPLRHSYKNQTWIQGVG